MSLLPPTCKCTRCRHKYHESEQVRGPVRRNGFWAMVCPKCGCKTYTRLPVLAADNVYK